MKRSLKWIAFFVIMLSLTTFFVLSAGAETEGYYIYTVENDEATITDVDAAISGDIVIPDTFGGYPVTSIGANAFEDCASITSIDMPDAVTSIGWYAFRRCTGLISIEIPSGVTSISSTAFSSCGSLTSIIVEEGNSVYHSSGNCLIETASKTLIAGCQTSIIPDDGSVTSIGNNAFSWCTELQSIEIPSSVTSIGDLAFYNCSSLESVTFAEGSLLESISWNAFYGCSSLTSIDVPNSVTSIGSSAFYGCSSLTSVTFAEGSQLASIGGSAFSGCTALQSIEIPNSVTRIGSFAFRDCTALESITIPFVGAKKEGTTNTHFGYIFGASSYSYNNSNVPTSLKKVTIIGGNSIGDFAFYYCSSLTSIEIPSSVTSIGRKAFMSCSALQSIEIPSSVTSIGSSAFYGCTQLTYNTYDNAYYLGNENNPYVALIEAVNTFITSCTIHASTKVIYSDAFEDTALQSIEIPSSVTSIGGHAFARCSALTSITVEEGNSVYHSSGNCLIETASKTLMQGCNTSTIPNDGSVTSIGDDAFSGCDALQSIDIPSSVTSIGNYAFCLCKKLTSIKIPSGVTSIGNSAFYNCSSLQSIEIPSSVTSIDWYAFYYCTALQSIEIPSSVTSIGVCAFRYCSSLASVTFAADSQLESIGDEAFQYCSALQIIEIPSSVTSIGSSAFSSCDSLASVTFAVGSQLESIGSSAFSSCDSLASVTFAVGSQLESIGNRAFSGCSSLASVTFAEGSLLTSIGDYAFQYCGALQSIEIPSSVTSIGASAFSGCTALQSIEIPSSVTSIGESAFENCYNLADIYYSGSEEEWSAISKGSDWDYAAGRDTANGTYKVYYYCNDGDVIAYQVTKGEDGVFSLRLIAGLNSIDYRNLGFEVKITTKDENGNEVVKSLFGKSYKAYSSIYGGTTEYSIKDMFGFNYGCFATITELAIDSTYTKIDIYPYVTMLDGTKKQGESAAILYSGEIDESGYPIFSKYCYHSLTKFISITPTEGETAGYETWECSLCGEQVTVVGNHESGHSFHAITKECACGAVGEVQTPVALKRTLNNEEVFSETQVSYLLYGTPENTAWDGEYGGKTVENIRVSVKFRYTGDAREQDGSSQNDTYISFRTDSSVGNQIVNIKMNCEAKQPTLTWQNSITLEENVVYTLAFDCDLTTNKIVVTIGTDDGYVVKLGETTHETLPQAWALYFRAMNVGYSNDISTFAIYTKELRVNIIEEGIDTSGMMTPAS